MTSVDSAIKLTMTFLALLHFVPFASRHAGSISQETVAHTQSVCCV